MSPQDPSHPEPPVVVLYVAGDGRSGSTLLGRLLGCVDDLLDLGELRYVWERGVVEGRPCQCGRPPLECDFWGPLLREAFGADLERVAAEAAAASNRLLRTRTVPSVLRGDGGVAAHLATEPAYREALVTLYAAIGRAAPGRVVVDSSKLPLYGAMVRELPGVDLRVVHLVRDARAVAASWRRLKKQGAGEKLQYMTRQSLAKSAAVWSAANVLTDRFLGDTAHHLTLRYEDVVAEPVAALTQLYALVGVDAVPPVDADRTVDLRVGHSVAGNPDRFRSGPTKLRLDDAWTHELSRPAATFVQAATAPARRTLRNLPTSAPTGTSSTSSPTHRRSTSQP